MGYWTLLRYNMDEFTDKCPNCGKRVGKTALFCIRCGTKFTKKNGELDKKVKKLTKIYWTTKLGNTLKLKLGRTPTDEEIAAEFNRLRESGKLTKYTTL